MLIYILVIIFFSSSNTKIQERKEKNKKTQSSAPSPHSRISIDPCTSKIRNIYLQKTKTKQTKRELGGGWAGDLRVKRKERPPQGGGWPHRVKVNLNPLCSLGRVPHQESQKRVPSAMAPLEGRGSEFATQPCGAFVVRGFHHPRSPPCSPTDARTYSQALTRMRVVVAQCSEDGAGAPASVKWRKTPLGTRAHCPISSLSDRRCNMPSSSLKGFQLLGNINAGMVIG